MITPECKNQVCTGGGEPGWFYSHRHDVWEPNDVCLNEPELHSDLCSEHGGEDDWADFKADDWEYHFDAEDPCTCITDHVSPNKIEERIERGMPRGEALLANHGK